MSTALVSLPALWSTAARAQDWTGAVSADWLAGGNWSTGTVPNAASDVRINTPRGATTRSAAFLSGSGTSGSVRIGTDSGALNSFVLSLGGTLRTSGDVIVGAGSRLGSPVGTGLAGVYDPGSRWDVGGQFVLGGRDGDGQGFGEFSVANGAVLASGSGYIFAGSATGADARMVVTGANSRWTSGDLIIVGPSTGQRLRVTGGGTVDSGRVVLASTAEVTGAGSTWNTDRLELGLTGALGVPAGTLRIANGGSVASRTALIGAYNSISPSAVRVDGAGSRWTVAGPLDVASGNALSVGLLALANGGVAEVGGGTGLVTLANNPAWPSFAWLQVGESATDAPGTLRAARVDTGANGAVWFRHNATAYDFAPAIIGLGKVVAFAGTTTLTGANTYSGGTTVEAGGTLAGTTSSFGTGGIANNGTLVLDQATDGTFSNALSGGGLLVKRGTGTVTVSAANTFNGLTDIAGGTLAVDGTLRRNVQVLAGGTLGGTGQVGSVQVRSGGTIAPGNGIGTLSAGDVNFFPGSTFLVEAAPDGTADRLLVSDVDITGGTVAVRAGTGTYGPSTTYTILTTGSRCQGVQGRFDGVTSNFAFLTPTLGYDRSNVYLMLTRNAVTFPTIGGTRNQRAAGRGVEALGAGPVYNTVLQLDAPAARAAFDQLSGEIHASAQSALIEDSRFPRDAALERLRSASAAPGAASVPAFAYAGAGSATEAVTLWGQGFGAWGRNGGDGNAARLERSSGGFLIGADRATFANGRLGLFAGYGRTGFDVRERRSAGASDNYHLGLYGGTEWGDLALRAGAAYTWHDLSTRRSVAFPGFADTLTGGYGAATRQAFGEVGYAVRAGDLAFEPFANLAHVGLSTDRFRERGGAAALSGIGEDTDTTFTTLGLRASGGFAIGALDATARAGLGWRHAFDTVASDAAMGFAGGTPFVIVGVPVARDAALAEAGLDVALSSAATLGLSYGGQFSARVRDQFAKANLTVRF